MTTTVERDTATSEPIPVRVRVRVRPRPTLLASGLLSFGLMSAPLFTALFVLSIPIGTWPIILAVQLSTLLFALICLVRYLMAFVAVEDDTLVYRAFTSPVVRIPLSRVDTMVLAETYRWNAPDSVPQLLLLDADGCRVDRMRGTFWREEDIRAVAVAVDRPISHFPDPITAEELFATHPTARYWFETRVAATIGAVVALTGALVAVPCLMALTGIPLFSG